MRNGIHSDSNANSLDSPSAQDPSPNSPSDSSHLKRRSTSPSSLSHGKKRLKSSHSDTNGHSHSDHSSRQDDSEAETVHLSDQGSETSKVKHKFIKKEPNDRNRVASPSLTMRSDLVNSRPGSRESSTDRLDRPDKRSNGIKVKENGLRNGVSRPSGLSKTDALRNEGRNSRAHSAEHSANDDLDKPRSSSAHDRRKRKHSDPLRASHVEPPRQKLRLDGNIKERKPSPGGYVKSPPISAASLRGHRRSASTQSHIPKPPLSAPLLSRDTRSTASNDGRDWDSDYSSDEDSPQRTHTVLSHPPTSRQAMMALASPAPVGAPHKRTDKFGLTALAKACEKGKLESVKSAYEIAPDDLDFPDNAGYAPLQKAALYGHADIVEFLLKKGCRIDCRSKNGDTPLIDASENSHTDVLKLLIEHGVNPHHQNEKGLRAIDLVDEADDDDAELHKDMLRKAMKDYDGPESEDEGHLLDLPAPGTNQERKDLLHKEANLKNLLHYAQRGDLQAVDHFLSMKLKPNVECCVVAARGGFEHTLTLLLTDVADKDPDPAEFSETPMLAAIGRGHLKIIRLLLTQNDSVFNPCRKTKDGKYYWQIAEERQGRHWEAERDLLKEYFEKYQAQHGGKSIKKKKALQDSPKHKRVASSSKVDSMKAPPVPKLLKTKTADGKMEKSEKGKRDKDLSNKVEDAPRRKKLMSARDLHVVEGKPRRRRVVEDESSPTIESDEDADIRAPIKNIARRKSSSASKSSIVKTEEILPPSRPRLDKHDKAGRPQTSTPRRTVSRSPVAERRKSIQATHTKDTALRASVEPPAPTVREISPSLTEDITLPDEHDSEASGPVALQQAAAQAEAEQKAAELRLQEAEQARKLAAEKQEQEERSRKEAMAAREARLAAVPGALRAAMEMGVDRPMCHTIVGKDDLYSDPTGVGYQFLPLREWYLADIDPFCAPERREERWTLSHQVVGLLGLPELNLDELPTMTKIPVTDEQRQAIVDSEPRIERLASYTYIDYGMPDPDYYDRACEKAKQQLLKLDPWYFVPVDDFLACITKYPHLEGHPITRETQVDLRPRQEPETEAQANRASLTEARKTAQLNSVQVTQAAATSNEVNGSVMDVHIDGSSQQDDVDAEGELEDEQDALMANA